MQITNLLQTYKTSFKGYNKAPKVSSNAQEQKENSEILLAYGADISALNNVATVKFSKGIATKDDEPYTGSAAYTDKNGDKFIFKFEGGKLIKSAKNTDPATGRSIKGKNNFVKTYAAYVPEEYYYSYFITRKEDGQTGAEVSTCEMRYDKCNKGKGNVTIIRTNPSGQHAYTEVKNGIRRSQGEFDGIVREWNKDGSPCT